MNVRDTAGTDVSNASNQPQKSTPAAEGSTVFREVTSNTQSKILGLIFACVASFLLGLVMGGSFMSTPLPTTSDIPSMDQCVNNTILQRRSPDSQTTPDILRQSVEHCYSLIRSYGILRDFSIRELNFIQQYRANGVLMWMVVIVTLSGVALAGLQLYASYKLAAANKKSIDATSDLTLKINQASLKSSVTGLFILLTSFGFFLVFVFFVYKFDPPHEAVRQAPALPLGGLGPPPTTPRSP